MDAGVHNDLCRVTVLTPSSRIDVALPVHVPLAELIPTLLRACGIDPLDQASRGSGWSMQRFGQSPMDVGLTPASLSILDGEVLYLRPRQVELPEPEYDDVADAIASATARSRRWTDADTRRTGLGLSLVALAVAVALILSSGPPWGTASLVAGVIALVLLAVAGVLSRGFGDPGAGRVPGYAAVVFAALGAATALGGSRSLAGVESPSVLGAVSAAMVMAAVVALVLADGVPGLVGLGVAALLGLVATVLDLTTSVGPAGAAAVAIVLGLGLTLGVPALALRLAKLPLPAVPTTADDVRRDATTVDGADVVRRALVADQYVTALVGAVALVAAVGEVVLSRRVEPGAQWLVALVALVTALRARDFGGRLQRSFLLAAAAVGGGAAALSLATGQSGPQRLLVLVAPLGVASLLLVAAAVRLPGRTRSPVGKRATDLLDGFAVLSLIPVTLDVLGVYGYVRGLNG